MFALCIDTVSPINTKIVFRRGIAYPVISFDDDLITLGSSEGQHHCMDECFFTRHFMIIKKVIRMSEKEGKPGLFGDSDGIEMKAGGNVTILESFDISHELYREYDFRGRVYRINNPAILLIRPGGVTHRVVDADGVTHCVLAPGYHGCVIRWKSKEGEPAV
jgi:hypothetical protein